MVKKLNRFDQLYIFVLIIVSGFGISFFRGIEGFVAIGVLNILVLLGRKLSYSYTFYKAVGIWLLYCVVVGLLYSDFSPFFILKPILYLSVAYSLASYDRKALFNVYVTILYFLSVVSLIFWGVHVFYEEGLYLLYYNFGIDTYFEREYYQYSTLYRSLIFYTYSNLYAYETILPRNYGFCWEPGPFSVFILIALYFNIVLNNFKLTLNRIQIILIATLFSTQSTTGLSGLFLLYIYIFISTSYLKASKLVLVPALLVFIVFIYFSSSTFYAKVDTQLQGAAQLTETIDKSVRKNVVYSAGRFGGFLIAWNDFKKSPFVGLGDSKSNSYGTADGSQVYIVNGLASIMSMYGLFGIVILFLYLKRTSFVFISDVYNGHSYRYAFFVIMIASFFGFSFHLLPIIFSFVFYSIFVNSTKYD